MEHYLEPWERQLLSGKPEGIGDVTFTRTDGRTVKFENVKFDQIGPVATNPGVVTLELQDGSLRHVLFVESWEITY
jgi:hypothetical protein